MKVFSCKQFEGHYPVGTAAVIVAPDRFAAADMLNEGLLQVGLKDNVDPSQMVEIDPSTPAVYILLDGNY